MLEKLADIPAQFWAVLIDMAPFLLFGFLAAGVLSVLVSPALIERHLGGRGAGPVIKAAALGIPLPLCSCGVIPVAASLRKHGAGKGATTAFLISTPQTGIDSIFVTFGLLGGVFAVFRPLVALAGGLVGGAAVDLIEPDEHPKPATPQSADADPRPGRGGKIVRAITYALVTLPGDIGKPLLAGLVVAALISVLVPKDFFAPYLGGGPAAILGMMLLGIPIYVCATASVPIAAALILSGGVSPGAAFAFLMTGPATNAATIITVWKLMGRKTAGIYLGTMAAASLMGGLALDYVFVAGNISPAPGMGWMLPNAIGWGSAVVLLGVLAVAILRPYLPKRRKSLQPQTPHLPTATFRVTGMTCSHCAESLRRALLECDGVESAQVDLPGKLATITGMPPDVESLHSAARDLGYGLTATTGKDNRQ